MGDFSTWLKLSADISSSTWTNFQCPECQKETVDFQYVGDTETRIGYLEIWCDSCLKGIHISRVRVPESANLLSFEDKNLIGNRIPAFKQVVR
ncbi:hypothetical protein [Chengkuizengella sediminis]|uniref:hypothetical protein n=1 Tax=Chengkuizengella sediminis TaxID=1885917 RepID=UPI00138A4578|nr:hypothetical protein [Chengkuizengella sediminis]NDI35097.1 hypothetical protein [Chengkuizengella sediminis]